MSGLQARSVAQRLSTIAAETAFLADSSEPAIIWETTRELLLAKAARCAGGSSFNFDRNCEGLMEALSEPPAAVLA